MLSREDAEKAAAELEAGLKRDGIWDKLDSFLDTKGDFVIVKEGDHLVVYDGENWASSAVR